MMNNAIVHHPEALGMVNNHIVHHPESLGMVNNRIVHYKQAIVHHKEGFFVMKLAMFLVLCGFVTMKYC